jgi:hypothetical protein
MDIPPKHVRFTHAPLNFKSKEIRLITIEPSSELSSPIQITIKHVDFSRHVDALARCQQEIAKLEAEGELKIMKRQRQDIYVSFLLGTFDFIALSYTWGPEFPAHDILVTGPNSRGWLLVRQNLYDFLNIERDRG